jgi:hypothetical protein
VVSGFGGDGSGVRRWAEVGGGGRGVLGGGGGLQMDLRASPKAPQKSPLNLFFEEKHKNMSPTVPLKRPQLFHSP